MVSIIIPCYNQGIYIREAISSVKAQTYSPIEILIVNDGSDDAETKTILDELTGEEYTVINIKNSGVSVARNTGIAAAKGEYILPLDADDKIGPEYIAKAVEVLAKNAVVKLVYCDCEYFGEQTGLTPEPPFSMEGMLSRNIIFNAALMRKNEFLQSGGYDPAFLQGWEDWDLWLKYIHSENQVYKIPGVHFFYRLKQGSRNELVKEQRLQDCEQQLFKKHIDLFLAHYKKPISMLRDHEVVIEDFKLLDEYRRKIRQSTSFRLGYFLLSPFIWMRKIIKK